MPAPGLSAYPAWVRGLTWTALGSAGGLSEARLHRGNDGDEPRLALKVWPADWPAGRLRQLHTLTWSARLAGCDWVPETVLSSDGDSVVALGTRWVDVATWVPGAPVLRPGASHLQRVGRALAELASAWRGPGGSRGPAPAVARHLAALAAVPATWVGVASEATRRLRPWQDLRGPVHPVHGDLRVEHVLFVSDTLTGVIDFGAARLDHPATDLARYAADIGPAAARPLCDAYAAAGGGDVDEELVAALAFSGLVVAAARWSGVAGMAAVGRCADRVTKLTAWRDLESRPGSRRIAPSGPVEG